jgi:hypothetical protein
MILLLPQLRREPDLVLRNLITGEEKTFPLVSEYYFDKKGTKAFV